MLQMEVVTVEGAPTVVRRGFGDAARSLRLTGERLRRATHPGVVEVVASTGDETAWELHLAHSGRPLESFEPTTAVEVARIVAGIAQTLADLHDVGVVHGHLDASHVLVAIDGRPVLCGFGPDDGGRSPADDVAAVGALLVELLGREPDLEPIPERRWRRQRTWSGWQRRSLLLLADQATAEPETRRPTARRLAAAIAEAVPDPRAQSRRTSPRSTQAAGPLAATTVDDVTVRPAVEPQPQPRPQLRPAGTAAALAVVALLAVGLFRAARSGDGSPPSQTAPTGITPLVDDQPAATVDGNVVTMGERRYEIGEPGDIVVVGDWDCDGTDTPALLRPATGGLFVFDRWAGTSPMEVTPVRVVDGANGLRGLEEPQGCDRLVVRRQDGSEVAVRSERAA